MRIAVVGGTGSFGGALARRLAAAGDEVVIGSRDAERAASAAAELGVEGATNADACRDADLVVLATRADATLDTARELRGAIGSTPVLCVAAELTFAAEGVLPTADARSLAARVQDVVAGPVVAGLHSLAARNLGRDDPPAEDALLCGDDAAAKELVLALARADHVRPRDRLRPARVCSRARGADGRDREREQALQGPRGRAALRRPVNGVRRRALC